MAIVPVQKVAALAHKAHEAALLDFLHREGVMEIAEMPSSSDINSEKLPFHIAELDHVIALLGHYAAPATLAATEAHTSTEEIFAAGNHPTIRAIIDKVHALEEREAGYKEDLQELDHGRLPRTQRNITQGIEEGAYFLSPSVTTNLSSITASGDAMAPMSERVAAKTREVQEALDAIKREWADLARELPILCRARQCAAWMNEIEAARRAMTTTGSTVAVFGWLPRAAFQKVAEGLRKLAPATALVPVAPDPNEQPPILIKNPAWLKPFESVTLLYGLPQSGELDPTPLLAPFFILFFALCLTDAAYGAILAVAMAIFIRTKRISLQKGPLWWLLMISGIVTFFVSIPFGGWFGMSPDQAPAFMTELRADGARWFKGQVWNLGATPGITFFQNLSIVLGLIHLSFGMFLGGLSKGLRGSWSEGFWVDWTQLLLIGAGVGLFFAPPHWSGVARASVYASVAIVIWGKGYGSPWYCRPITGFLGLLNLAMGMMSNVLSYLRLLALGLVTGALALAVNLVAAQIGGFFPPIIGIPVSIVIYIAGHTVNIALNVLGAFIHSGRLQFVEFFSQFFEGGGRPLTPFRRLLHR